MFGQFGHFTKYAPEKIPYAIERYTKEVKRLLGVLKTRLTGRQYIMGDDYTIAGVCIVLHGRVAVQGVWGWSIYLVVIHVAKVHLIKITDVQLCVCVLVAALALVLWDAQCILCCA